MNAGTVDSPRRTDRETVKAFIAEAAPGAVGVSRAARGLDQRAKEAPRARGLTVAVHTPDLEGAVMRWQMMDRNYAQNERNVNDSDMIVAFVVAPDRTSPRGYDPPREACR
jgi:hypothetical protein